MRPALAAALAAATLPFCLLAAIVIPQHSSDTGGGLWGLGVFALIIVPAVAIVSLLVGIGVGGVLTGSYRKGWTKPHPRL